MNETQKIITIAWLGICLSGAIIGITCYAVGELKGDGFFIVSFRMLSDLKSSSKKAKKTTREFLLKSRMILSRKI